MLSAVKKAEASPQSPLTEEAPLDVFVARQPIFDAQKVVVAYELLYRSGRTGGYDATDGNQATATVIMNSFTAIGLDRMTGGRRAFINFTRDFLISEFATVLPKDFVVVEILENIAPEVDVVAACQRLKDEGYILALDDFVLVEEQYRPLIRLADIIKVDCLAAEPSVVAQLPAALKSNQTRLLAEKIETEEMFKQAVDWGYDLFQGYFFSKPTLLEGKDVPAFKLNYLRILQRIHEPMLDFDDLEQLVRAELSLSYRLLRYINSAWFSWRQKVESIRQALVGLGEQEFRKWVSLVCLTGMGEDKPRELLVQSTIRAHFCEQLAGPTGLAERKSDLFITGLFSHLETIIGRPLREILETIPVSQEVRLALTHGRGLFGDVLAVVKAYERGDWDAVANHARRLGIAQETLPQSYLEAVEKTQAVFSSVL